MRRSIIVVSATNIAYGGPLSVLEDFLAAWTRYGNHRSTKIVVFFGGDRLRADSGITVIRTPQVARSWICRAVFEFISAARIAGRLRVHLWLSFQDSVPRLTKVPIWLYCHKATYLGAFRLRYVLFAPRMLVERFVFRTWLSLMMPRSERVIAQQIGFVRALGSRFRYRGTLTVCPPSISTGGIRELNRSPSFTFTGRKSRELVVIYPAYPRVHKNFEAAIKAVELASRNTGEPIQLKLTLSGTENLYSRYILWRFRKCKHVDMIGFLPREQVYEEYGRADAMLFTSELETWGMPLSEFALTGKPIVAFDWPYVRDTLRSASNLWLAQPGSVTSLASTLAAALHLSARNSVPRSRPVESTVRSESVADQEQRGTVDVWRDWRDFASKLNERLACER
jgi:glycosyltransferase involved in cell wall biosynthesis